MKNITLQKHYNFPIQKVWEAISSEQALSEWFLPGISFKAEKGFRLRFEFDKPDCAEVVIGEVLEAESPHKLSYTWKGEEMTDFTTVTWLLQEKDGGTLLTLEHSGFDKLVDYALAQWESFEQGWTYFTGAIEDYIAKHESQEG